MPVFRPEKMVNILQITFSNGFSFKKKWLKWGSSHEGSGRHSRQHGGGRGRRFIKFVANSHRVCSLLRPSFCELIVNVMGHIDAESRAAVTRHLAAIPAQTFTRRRGCRSCLFSRGRGCRSALTKVPLCAERRASLVLRTAAKLGTVYIFLDTKSHLTFYHILIWSFGHNCIIDWPFDGNCFEFFLSKGNIFAYGGKYQLFGEHCRSFSYSFTQISNIVLEFRMCFNSNTVECHFDLPPGFCWVA